MREAIIREGDDAGGYVAGAVMNLHTFTKDVVGIRLKCKAYIETVGLNETPIQARNDVAPRDVVVSDTAEVKGDSLPRSNP